MLLALRQLLQERSLAHAVQEELSVFSGGTLHHIGQLLAHTLMYHATLLVSPKGRHIQRLLLSACCLADILPGESACLKGVGVDLCQAEADTGYVSACFVLLNSGLNYARMHGHLLATVQIRWLECLYPPQQATCSHADTVLCWPLAPAGAAGRG